MTLEFHLTFKTKEDILFFLKIFNGIQHFVKKIWPAHDTFFLLLLQVCSTTSTSFYVYKNARFKSRKSRYIHYTYSFAYSASVHHIIYLWIQTMLAFRL